MTIVQMRYFNTVCQYMNLTKAAEQLHISQPALSAVIKQIEVECGVQLFKHRANSITITDEGLVLQQEVIPILEQYKHLEQLLSTHKLERNYLRVGLSPFRGNAAIPEIAARFRREHPDTQLLITEGGTQFLFENLDLILSLNRNLTVLLAEIVPSCVASLGHIYPLCPAGVALSGAISAQNSKSAFYQGLV